MSEAHDTRQENSSIGVYEKHHPGQDILGENLLNVIEGIKPEDLGDRSHAQYLKQVKRDLTESLLCDNTHFILLVQSIKDCKTPCYKRDFLIQVLDLIIFSEDNVFNKILGSPVRQWKELANSIVMLPDLIANCRLLESYMNFKADSFYSDILEKIYQTVKNIKTCNNEQQWFYIQIIGRIALSGFNQLVWEKITSRAINEECTATVSTVAEVLACPLIDDKFELFIEPLYIPIFFNLKPSKSNGRFIHSIIGDWITSHEELKYIICNKSILQTNYLHDKNHQSIILFNTFAYLSYIDSPLLIDTLVEIAKSWSHRTKVMLRPYEHSRFIGCALVLAFRFALEFKKENLAKFANTVQSIMMKGVSSYLNRASYEHRNLAMCLCEIIFPKLQELTHNRPDKIELEFEVDWDEDCLQIKRLFDSDFDKLNLDKCDKVPKSIDPEKVTREADCNKSKEDDDSSEEDELDCYEGDASEVPIYLRDCINGMVENKTPRYVRLCLIKAGELIRQHSEVLRKSCATDAIDDNAVELAQILLHLDNQFNIEFFDSYRMKALISLCVTSPALVVKYLLDEFNGSNRSIRLQLDILQALVASASELSSYSKDTNSKDKCEKGTTNRFAKYACLYFYGIVHKLKADISDTILPTTLISAARSLRGSSSSASVGSQESMIRKVIKGIGDSKSQLKSGFSAHLPIRSPVYVSMDQSLPSEKSYSRNEKMTEKGGELPKVEEMGAKTKSTSRVENNAITARKIKSDEKKDCYWIDDGHRLLITGEDYDNSNYDDSYLLSRMLFSLSLIIKCLNQQPITCKLSSELLDILAAYRCHPDSGVRKAIVACLTLIRDCTPKVYFEECLNDKTMCLFGVWLANQAELIKRLRL